MVPQPLTTAEESEVEGGPSTTGPEPAGDTTEIIIISVVVPIGVVLFTVFMTVGLIAGFRYLLQKLIGENSLIPWHCIPQSSDVLIPL